MEKYNHGKKILVPEKVIESLPSSSIYETAHNYYEEMLRSGNYSIEEIRLIADLLRLFVKIDYGS